jgi:signal transduction histidine kinase
MFLVLLLVLFVTAFVTNYFWTTYMMSRQTETELTEKGQVLSKQMDAMWSFMAANQEQLEQVAFTETGSYMGLHCAIVGRSVGLIFSQETKYTTRFVNFNPRNLSDAPDEFEAEALTAFLNDKSVTEYHAFTTFDGMEVFRYSAPMQIQESCLECHGEPIGALDVTGYPREGWKIGDVGGAISIVIPLDIYSENAQNMLLSNIIFFSVLLLLLTVCIWFALSYLVASPLNRIQAGVRQMQKGDLDIRLSPTESSRELSELVNEFNDMSNELANIYSNLENQVTDRTLRLSEANELLKEQRAQLEDINRRLIEENRYKSDFLAMMSHELRTPLTSIIAFADMLGKGWSDLGDAGTQELCAEIDVNSQLLLNIINDILDMSRIDAGKAELNLELVDFGDLATSVEPLICPLADQRGVKFTCSVDGDVPLVQADFDKLQHVLVNLLSNAVKFTPDGGTIGIAITHDEMRGEVVCAVHDTGIGIAVENQQEIFDRFRQIDSSDSRKYSGTGLGLALVKEYTQMHGGSVSVESKLGEGCTFKVHIPVRHVTGEDVGETKGTGVKEGKIEG